MTTTLVIGWIFAAVVAFMLGKGGLDKIRGSHEAISNFAFMKLQDHRRIIGVFEILAAVFLLIPSLQIAGIFLVCCLMSGAAALHLSLMGGQKTWLPILMIVLSVASYFLRVN